jgi:hypothetical protein
MSDAELAAAENKKAAKAALSFAEAHSNTTETLTQMLMDLATGASKGVKSELLFASSLSECSLLLVQILYHHE